MTAQAVEPTPAGPVGATPKRAAKPPRPILRMVIMLLLVGVVLFLIFGFGAFRNIMIGKFLAKLKNPPQTVATVIAEKTPFQPRETATGTLIARQGAALSAQTAGIVQSIDFHSGDDVRKGQLLVTLRPNNDEALLAQLQATATLDRVTYQRDLAQYHAQAVSMQTVDTDRGNLASAEAQVKSQQALMAEKKIYAPFSGRIGIRQVDLGQYLAAGTTIASLETLNPIDIDFYLPQAALRTIHPGMKIQITVNAFEATPFTGTIEALDSSVSTTTRMIQVRASLNNPHNELRPGMFARVAIDVGAPANLVTLPQTAIAYNPYGDTVFLAVKDKNTPNSPAGAAAGTDKTAKHPSLQARQVFVTLGSARGDQVSVVKGVGSYCAGCWHPTFRGRVLEMALNTPSSKGSLPGGRGDFSRNRAAWGHSGVGQTLWAPASNSLRNMSQGVTAGQQVIVAGQMKLRNGTPLLINNKILPSNSPNPVVPNH